MIVDTTLGRRLRERASCPAAVLPYFSGTHPVLSRPASEIDPSRLTTVQRGDLARSVVAIGKIEPISKVEIKSKANGIIKEIKVQIGDLVQEGQILVELDKENLQARLHEARAALLGAQANVKAAQAEFEKNKIEAEGVDVAFARRNRDRAEQLAKDGLLPQSKPRRFSHGGRSRRE